jgi:hypothetical protein
MACIIPNTVSNCQSSRTQSASNRGMTLLRELPQEIIPVITVRVDRISYPRMAADPSFVRLLGATDAHKHIFALHRPYHASFGVTDSLSVNDPTAVEQHTYQVEASTHSKYLLHTPKGDLTAHYSENNGVHMV